MCRFADRTFRDFAGHDGEEMKTLDEVIAVFEKACDLERRCEDCMGCLSQEYGCPNDGSESIPDALEYLKEYQDMLKSPGKMVEYLRQSSMQRSKDLARERAKK